MKPLRIIEQYLRRADWLLRDSVHLVLPETVRRNNIKDQYIDFEVAHRYDEERFSNISGRLFNTLEIRALRQALRTVRRHCPNPLILDAPCGSGRITQVWLTEGLKVTGGDISSSMLKVAREKLRGFKRAAQFCIVDLEKLGLNDDSFDLVSCIRLFHHLDTYHRARILREIGRVSKRFVLVNVSLSSPYHSVRRRLKRFVGLGHSRRNSTWKEISREAQEAGLRIHSLFYVNRLISEDLILLYQKASNSGLRE